MTCPRCGTTDIDDGDGWPITVGGVVATGGCQLCWEDECAATPPPWLRRPRFRFLKRRTRLHRRVRPEQTLTRRLAMWKARDLTAHVGGAPYCTDEIVAFWRGNLPRRAIHWRGKGGAR
jgi:hypothetical protein